METPLLSSPPTAAAPVFTSPSSLASAPAEKRHSEIAVGLGLLGDAAVAFAVLLAGFWLQSSGWLAGHADALGSGGTWWNDVVYAILAVVALLACCEYHGAYRRELLLNTDAVIKQVAAATTAWLFVCAGLTWVFGLEPVVSRTLLAFVGVAGAAGLCAWRRGFHLLLRSGAVAGDLRQRVVLLGWSEEASRLVSRVWKYETDPYTIIGYVSLRGKDPSACAALATVPYLGDYEELAAVLAVERADIALLADLNTEFDTTQELVRLCERELVQFKIIPSYFPVLVSGLHVELVSGTPLLGIDRLPLARTRNQLLKRAFDIVGGLVGLALSFPLVLVFGTLVYLESPGPIFYRQRRLGFKGRCFEMIKIRSMRLDAETPGKVGWTTKNDPRRLQIGTFMRKWNIDEVPQFWNVLKGEMSLVGPRPERPELIANFKHDIAHYNARHFVKPGLTGWAQVNGLRGDTDLAERIRHDLHYMEHWSLWLDVRAMVLTFLKRQNAC